MKLVKLFILSVCMSTQALFAQFSDFPFSFGSQALVEAAVEDGLFIIRQKYQLKEVKSGTPAYYGWNNQPHFGTTYTLGIKVTNGFYTDDKALHPWNYDTNYAPYRANADYEPVISETGYRPLGSTKYEVMPFSTEQCHAVDSPFVFVQNETFRQKGFPANNGNGKKNGWLVWAVSDRPVSASDTVSVSLTIYRAELVFEEGKNVYEIKEPAIDNKEIVGGIYVTPEATDVGQLTFGLSGILSKVDNKWKVVRTGYKSGAASASAAGGDGLTPVDAVSTPSTGTGLTPVDKQDVKPETNPKAQPSSRRNRR
ncbi:MAG: hypothetical protein LBL33_06755 [Tannerella sp.]|jgi:hypothetical protein|nr:hypothetical protein [Tannerella sp.]